MRIHFALALSVGSSSVCAAERPVDRVECKDITARLVQITNADFQRFSPFGDNVFLKHHLAGEMVLSCSSHRLTGISLSWETAYPSNSWFHVAANAGEAVTGASSARLQPLIRKCHSLALKSKTELAELDVPNAKIECQAFTRDGGGVSMSIWINDHEARKGVEEP
jgi:hypothetical protein